MVDPASLTLMKSQTDAMWFQVSASILTIVGAFGVVTWQHHFERLGAKADADLLARQRRGGLLALMEAVLEQARMIRAFHATRLSSTQVASAIGNAGRQLEGFRNLLANFDLAPVADSEVWKVFADVFGVLGIVQYRFASWESALTQGSDAPEAPSIMNGANELLDILIERTQRAIHVLGRA